MRRNRRIYCGIMVFVGLGGCAAATDTEPANRVDTPTPAEGSAPASDAPRPTAQSAEAPRSKVEPVLLRTALLPTDAPQAVRIRLDEKRTTRGEAFGTFDHALHLDLRGTLKRTGGRDNGDVEAELTLDQIRLRFGRPDQAGAMHAYDSAKDEPGQRNPLADVMSPIAGIKLGLVVDAAGRLRELHGFGGKWSGDRLLVEPELLTAQWLFRDDSMKILVAEALFPPMPADPVRPGDAWEFDTPANIPLVVRLDAHLRATLAGVNDLGTERERVTLCTSGDIVPAPELFPDAPAAIQPTVKTGIVKLDQTVFPSTASLRQHSTRTLEMQLTLTPPAGDERSRMTLHQTRTLSVTRGEPGSEPDSSKR